MFNVVNMIIIHFVHFTWDPFVEEKMFHPSIIQRGRTDNANNQIMRSLTLFKLFPPTAKDLIIIIARTPFCYTIWYNGVAYKRKKTKRLKMKNPATLLKKRGCRTLKNTILNHNQPNKLRKTQWQQHQAPQNWLKFLAISVLFPKPILDLFLNLIWIWFTQVWITNYATKDNDEGTD